MNKGELVDSVANSLGTAKTQVESVLNRAIDQIQQAVRKGEKVTLPGFGTFERRQRSARTGRNPRTGASIRIGASKVPAFKAGATFRDVVSGAVARKASPAKKKASPAKKKAAPAKKKASPAKKSPAKKKAPAKKRAPAKKSPARKSPARKSPAKKAKKAPARKR